MALNMYALYRLGSITHDQNALWLSYEWETFDNVEWRRCVEHFLSEIATLGHEVATLTLPPFFAGEDFVELVYSINGKRTIFSSDHLLSLITITTEDSSLLHDVWDVIGNKVGWVS